MIGCSYGIIKMSNKKKISLSDFSVTRLFSYPKKGESECQVNQRDHVLIRTAQS